MTRQEDHLFKPGLNRLLKDTAAQDMVEYCLVFACIGLLAIASTNGVAANVAQMLTTVGNGLTGSI